MSLTPGTPNREAISGEVVLVANEGCDASDYPANLSKNIALIKRGTCPFSTKSELAGQHGAIAAVVYNNANGTAAGTLGTPLPDHVPTFAISGEEAVPFVAALKNGTKLDGTAYIDGEVRTIDT
jgi:aminopeptidase Y